MISNIIEKSPADVLDYDFDFTRWMPAGDRIVNGTAMIEGTTASVQQTSWSDNIARVWLTGGADHEAGILTLLINTLEGRTKEVTASVRIRENS